MADTAVAAVAFTSTSGVHQSASINTGGTAVSTGDTAVLTAPVGSTRRLNITLHGTGASTATFLAGDEPPSERSGIGASSALTISSGVSYLVKLPAGQFVQDDGSVRILIGGTGPVEVSWYIDPEDV